MEQSLFSKLLLLIHKNVKNIEWCPTEYPLAFICSKAITETPDQWRYYGHCSGVVIVDFNQVIIAGWACT